MFEPQEIASLVQQTLATSTDIPPGHRGAFVTFVDQDQVKAVIAHRLSDDANSWVVTGYIDHPWSGGIGYGATIQKTW